MASVRQRIAQLEAEKTKLLDRMAQDFDGSLKGYLASVNKDLATDRDRLAHYAQFGGQN